MEFARRARSESNLGLAPLLDVVLLLLIFFVVTTSFSESRIALDLPEAETASVGDARRLVVSLSADGVVTLDGAIEVSDDVLDARFAEASREDVELELRADRQAEHGAFVELLDRARRAGIHRIGVAVDAAGH